MEELIRAGELFAGDYRAVRRLSAGGMGVVYVVEQASTRKLRALKLLAPKLLDDPASRAGFAREATIAAGLRTDHVVEVIDAGFDAERGLPWLVMELLEGENLGALVARRGPLAHADALDAFQQLCHGLGAAHAAGVVHRDLKPENVFVCRARRPDVPFTVKLLDFGIAKAVQEAGARAASSGSGNTATGQVAATRAVGSPLWMAPEQVRLGPIGPAADVWALGLLAFWAVTGRHYWLTASRDLSAVEALLAEKLFDPLETASARAAVLGVAEGALPEGFDAWFAQCVERDPARRFPDANAAFVTLRDGLRWRVEGPRAALWTDGPVVPSVAAEVPSGDAAGTPGPNVRSVGPESAPTVGTRRAGLTWAALAGALAFAGGAYVLGRAQSHETVASAPREAVLPQRVEPAPPGTTAAAAPVDLPREVVLAHAPPAPEPRGVTVVDPLAPVTTAATAGTRDRDVARAARGLRDRLAPGPHDPAVDSAPPVATTTATATATTPVSTTAANGPSTTLVQIAQNERAIQELEAFARLLQRVRSETSAFAHRERAVACTSGVLAQLEAVAHAGTAAPGDMALEVRNQLRSACEAWGHGGTPDPVGVQHEEDWFANVARSEDQASHPRRGFPHPEAAAQVLSALRALRAQTAGVGRGGRAFPCEAPAFATMRSIDDQGNADAREAARRVLDERNTICTRMTFSWRDFDRWRGSLAQLLDSGSSTLQSLMRIRRDAIERLRAAAGSGG